MPFHVSVSSVVPNIFQSCETGIIDNREFHVTICGTNLHNDDNPSTPQHLVGLSFLGALKGSQENLSSQPPRNVTHAT